MKQGIILMCGIILYFLQCFCWYQCGKEEKLDSAGAIALMILHVFELAAIYTTFAMEFGWI